MGGREVKEGGVRGWEGVRKFRVKGGREETSNMMRIGVKSKVQI